MNSFGFWAKLPRPFTALAPMSGITDAAFRRIVASYGRPEVIYTEFVSADGLQSPGRDALLPALQYAPKERPVVAQLFGAIPENLAAGAALIRELGFDGVDLNFGCPDRTVEKQGAGAALIGQNERVRQLIEAAKTGAQELPVSVKTRIGYDCDEVEDWIDALAAAAPAAIAIHARTRNQRFRLPVNWDALRRAVQIVRRHSPRIRVLGNGNILSLDDAHRCVAETGVDGVMIGRAAFGNPWVFAPDTESVRRDECLRVMMEHARLFEHLYGRDPHRFACMRKHFHAYINGFPGAKQLRAKLMQTRSTAEAEAVLATTGFYAREENKL